MSDAEEPGSLDAGPLRLATLLGRATLAWQSDYGQFYLVDGDDPAFQPPVDITAEMETFGLFAPEAGLVIYTNDCLQQHIRIDIYDREPVHPETDPMSGEGWTRVATAELRFPSLTFAVSSPSWPGPLPGGPVFFVASERMAARIAWREFEGGCDDSIPVVPDVIGITLWPRD